MPTYLHPGVYVEEIPSGVKPIEGVSTSVTAFVGTTIGGSGPVGKAVLVHGLGEYETIYGRVGGPLPPPASAAVSPPATTPVVATPFDYMGLAVQAYYLNGGRDAYIVRLADGADAKAYNDFFTNELINIRDASILVLPGKSYPADKGVYDFAKNFCESVKRVMLLVDSDSGTVFKAAADVTSKNFPSSTYAVLYYPWVEAANPLYHPDRNPNVPRTVPVPPSGFVAGMWAKIDGRRGVFKAPAGVETQLNGAFALADRVGDGQQDQLNPLGVNALRILPGYGPVIWGARTLATNTDPEWRYVPVRRTAIFIEQSLYNGIQWAVFEANDHQLWSSLRMNTNTFMNGLFRAGAFQGEKASDAYFVRCGLGDTMTQGDIDAGRVVLIVGFAPLKPAEFVILRLQQKVAQQ